VDPHNLGRLEQHEEGKGKGRRSVRQDLGKAIQQKATTATDK
jgi:hypothetical protein